METGYNTVQQDTNRPYTVISTATSLDGCIDDTSDKRLILSNEADMAEVDALRAASDAILVGAGTLRADNPFLRIRSTTLIEDRLSKKQPAHPLRVTITTTGELSTKLHFFEGEREHNLLYCPAKKVSDIERTFGSCALIRGYPGEAAAPLWISLDLKSLGVSRLLIEGGTQINSLFLKNDLVDELRLAIAPFMVGDLSAPRLINTHEICCHKGNPLKLRNIHRFADLVVLSYTFLKTEE